MEIKAKTEMRQGDDGLSSGLTGLNGMAVSLSQDQVIDDDLSAIISFFQKNEANWQKLTKFRAFVPVAWRIWARKTLNQKELAIAVECASTFGKNFKHVMKKRNISSDTVTNVLSKFTDQRPEGFEVLTLPRISVSFCDLLIIKRIEWLAASKIDSTIQFDVIPKAKADEYESAGLPRILQCYGVSDLMNPDFLDLYEKFNNDLTLVYRQGAEIPAEQREKTRKILAASIGKCTCITTSTAKTIISLAGNLKAFSPQLLKISGI